MSQEKEKITSQRDLDAVLSKVLRLGLFIAFVTTFVGGALLLWQNSAAIVDYQRFTGVAPYLNQMGAIFIQAAHGDPLAIIQLGIILLIATPIARVLSCVVVFAYESDWLYVGLSGFVLAILIYSFLSAR